MFTIVRRVAPAVVLVLLTWTAVDVLNPALCGLDQLPFVAAHNSFNDDTSAPERPPVASEDCFCCSHNVNFSATTLVATVVFDRGVHQAEALQSPSWKSFPLYHPPRLS